MEMFMNQKLTNSIINSINRSFIILSLIILLIVATIYIVFWTIFIDRFLVSIQNESNTHMLSQIENTFAAPIHMIEFGQSLINYDIIDFSDPMIRDPYFATTLSHNPDYIYSYSLGTSEGFYYGARRAPSGDIELMLVDESTQGHSVYYTPDQTLNTGEQTQVNKLFDPRTRPWYQLAVESDNVVFSPIYKHFIINDLAISISTPVYSNHKFVGVLGAHLILNELNQTMTSLANQYDGKTYIIDTSSQKLIANSLQIPNFSVSDDSYNRIPFQDIGSDASKEALSHYLETNETDYIYHNFMSKTYVRIVPYTFHNLEWLIILELPSAQIMKVLNQGMLILVSILFFLFIGSILIWNRRNKSILEPIIELTQVTQSYTNGNYMIRAKKHRDDEVGRLAESFNQLTETINDHVVHLEEKVKSRTEELEALNTNLLEKQNTILYLSYYDQLTGLYNRRYFKEKLKELDKKENFPASVVMIDMNGLKLINDAFGHMIGDLYLKQLASIIKHHMRDSDVAARYGGDEIALVLPNTDSNKANMLLNQLCNSITPPEKGLVPLSVSYGVTSLESLKDSLSEALNRADEIMYKNKLLESDAFHSDAINSLFLHLKTTFPNEYEHAHKMQELGRRFSNYLSLDMDQTNQITQAAYMHDIGIITLPKELVQKKSADLTKKENTLFKRHPEIGYRILKTAKETRPNAEIVLAHHENWNGKGYPKKLSKEEIPFESRLIHVIESYLTFLSDYPRSSFEDAKAFLLSEKGKELDPILVDSFIEMLSHPSSQ